MAFSKHLLLIAPSPPQHSEPLVSTSDVGFWTREGKRNQIRSKYAALSEEIKHMEHLALTGSSCLSRKITSEKNVCGHELTTDLFRFINVIPDTYVLM